MRAAVEANTPSASLPRNYQGFEVSLIDGTSPSVIGEGGFHRWCHAEAVHPVRLSRMEIYRSYGDLSHRVKVLVTKARPRISTDLGKPRLRVYARYIGRRAQVGPWSKTVEFSPRQP